jgi:hypothetical protein
VTSGWCSRSAFRSPAVQFAMPPPVPPFEPPFEPPLELPVSPTCPAVAVVLGAAVGEEPPDAEEPEDELPQAVRAINAAAPTANTLIFLATVPSPSSALLPQIFDTGQHRKVRDDVSEGVWFADFRAGWSPAGVGRYRNTRAHLGHTMKLCQVVTAPRVRSMSPHAWPSRTRTVHARQVSNRRSGGRTAVALAVDRGAAALSPDRADAQSESMPVTHDG